MRSNGGEDDGFVLLSLKLASDLLVVRGGQCCAAGGMLCLPAALASQLFNIGRAVAEFLRRGWAKLSSCAEPWQ